MAQVLFEASQFQFGVELPDKVLEKLKEASLSGKPQATLYKQLVSSFNPEGLLELLSRRGVEHLVDEFSLQSSKQNCDKIARSIG